MSGLRLIADDLTGALDSACAFTDAHTTVRIGLPGKPIPQGRRLAVSTESRSMNAEDASRAVTETVRALSSSDPDILWFKKIDSVMRGHPFLETKAALEAGGFDACVFAPAYPDMGRITRNGRQYTRVHGSRRRAVGPRFRDAFDSLGLAASESDGIDWDEDEMVAQTICVLNAGSQRRFVEKVRRVRRSLRSATLWVGSGGLAAALGSGEKIARHPPVGGVVIGTTHPVTQTQMSNAVDIGALVPIAKQVESPVWLLAPTESRSAFETGDMLRAEIPRIDLGNAAMKSIIVTGGDTLSIVLDATDAEFLECYGEVLAGVPLSRIQGGLWHGVTVLSKSGGFGAPDLLSKLISRKAGCG